MRHFSFDGMAGNATTFYLLKNSLRRGTFRNFSIFSGVLGTGKSTSAGIVAMGLTCDTPVEGAPCCKCPICKENMEALDTSGKAPYIKVVNLGLKNKFEDIGALIQDVFVLQGGSHNQVYILEEAHAAKDVKGGFTAFLAEIDRMPSNVYVIMCTTKINLIPDDLKSRAILYNFNRFTKKDGIALAKSIVEKSGYCISNTALEMIVNHSKGIPRNIEKLITMAAEDKISEEEIKSYLQVVDDTTFVQLFYALKVSDLAVSVEMLENIIENVTEQVFSESLKDFLLRVMFLIEGAINEGFTLAEKAEILEVFNSTTYIKVINIVKRLTNSPSKTDIMLLFMEIRTTLQGRTLESIVGQKASMAAKDRVHASRNESVMYSTTDTKGLTPLCTKSLESFGNVYEN